MSKFKVGDYVIFRRGMHKVADMLNTSFYDVLTSVYEITGTEGRCYLMRSDDGRGRVWKIRKSRIDRLGTNVTVINDVAVVADDKRRGSHLVSRSAVKREKRGSHDLFEEALSPDNAFIYMNRIEELKRKYGKERIGELADAFVRDVEKRITFFSLYKYDGSDMVGFRNKADDIDINKLKGHWPNKPDEADKPNELNGAAEVEYPWAAEVDSNRVYIRRLDDREGI